MTYRILGHSLQALGLEGVGLREIPPELANAMAARLALDGGINWGGGRPGASGLGVGKGYSPAKPGQQAGLGQGVVGGRQQVGVSPARRQAGGAGPSGGMRRGGGF